MLSSITRVIVGSCLLVAVNSASPASLRQESGNPANGSPVGIRQVSEKVTPPTDTVLATMDPATGVLRSPSDTETKNLFPAETGTSNDQLDREREAGSGGVMVFVDPVTGSIRQPSPEEIRDLIVPAPAAAVFAQTVPELIDGPGGAVGIVLGPDQRTYMVATISQEGELVIEEVTGESAADSMVESPELPNSPEQR